MLREGSFFRSAMVRAARHDADTDLLRNKLTRPKLDNASQQDRETLLQTYRIKTIIDLRSKCVFSLPLDARTTPTYGNSRSEHLEQAKIHDAQLQGSTVHHQPKTTRPESPRIPEIQYQEINLNGRSYERALFKKLKFSSQVYICHVSFLHTSSTNNYPEN